MYVEGGPEAQLYVNAGGRELEVVGSHGSSFAGIENTQAPADPERGGRPKDRRETGVGDGSWRDRRETE